MDRETFMASRVPIEDCPSRAVDSEKVRKGLKDENFSNGSCSQCSQNLWWLVLQLGVYMPW